VQVVAAARAQHGLLHRGVLHPEQECDPPLRLLLLLLLLLLLWRPLRRLRRRLLLQRLARPRRCSGGAAHV
jgi:hypothetical protein